VKELREAAAHARHACEQLVVADAKADVGRAQAAAHGERARVERVVVAEEKAARLERLERHAAKRARARLALRGGQHS
jgi:hypothetical protein